MKEEILIAEEDGLSADVDKGLSSSPKFLASKYFYDEVGDQLFVDIMNMPEYYLSRAEHEIFKTQSQQIIEGLELKKDTYFELIELGAGDGTKTKELLKELLSQHYHFDYLPIDISQHALDNLETDLKNELPQLSVKTKQGDYFEVLESIKYSKHPKVVLFLGSNIGNMEDGLAHDFLYRLGSNMHVNDKLFLGVDLIKPANIVLPAYDDPNKITAKFNLNLLNRINRELNADFEISAFHHQAEYNEEEGIAKSYLVSTVDQTVTITDSNKSFSFKAGEKIHTEISRKYNDKVLNKILNNTDLNVTTKYTDSKNHFADYIINRA